jgi:hypothetical protein
MKRFGLILVLLIAASPAWAVKKITVQQLQDMLASLQQQKKADQDVANELKQVVLTEQLTRTAENALVQYVPGPYSTEQIYVLEARSAVLPPPASDLPSTAALDAAAQKALLDKAMDYATKTYAQLPTLTATKTTLRFQDNVEAVASSSGMHSGATASSQTDPNLVAASQFVHYINSTVVPAEFDNGAEKVPAKPNNGQWGANGYIALFGQGPVLQNVLQEAQSAGSITWLRWELVNGKPAAVFTFSVDKKKTHYAVNYCCFPDLEQAGVATFSSSAVGSTAGGGGGGGGAKGNFQTTTSWKNYKTVVPYHGEVFIDPDTGIVVRLITQADFKNTDVVHQEDQRIDYGPVPVGSKTLVLPIKTVISTEVVPNGESGGGKFMLRHTMFTTEYKDYK